MTDAKQQETDYEYDGAGRRTKTIVDDQTEQLVDYDDSGRKIAETDQGGLQTLYEYDKLGRLTARMLPMHVSGRRVFDPAGEHDRPDAGRRCPGAPYGLESGSAGVDNPEHSDRRQAMAGEGGWYCVVNGEAVGPMDRQELLAKAKASGGPEAMVYGPGMADWAKARHVGSLAADLAGAGGPPPAPSGPRTADEIDYEIFGDDMQFVEITLDPNEVVVAEAGGMMYMTDGIKMETVFGDPSKQQGFLGKLLDAGKRMVTGESLFLTTFGNLGSKRAQVSFASPYPGKIIPMPLDQMGGEIICQKDAFLCAARGVQIGIAFQKKILTGLFGGEGFILQRLTGDGYAFVHAGGTIHKKQLAAGETIRLDTGCLVALQPSVNYDIQMVGGIKNAIFGGEGMFLATLTGPGTIWLQSLPFTRLAGRILANVGPKGKGEGSILGGLSNIFESRG